jgi:hypothetical protein
LEYVFSLAPAIDLLTYLDADLFFFSSPEPIFEEFGAASISLVPNRFSPSYRRKNERGGLYNVAWNTFRRDENGLACLRWWKERCIEWCYDYAEEGRSADQKYLDEWPQRFQGVRIISHPGADLAHWNLAGHVLRVQEEGVLVDGRPLIFFHFSGFREVTSWLFNTNLGQSSVRLDPILKKYIFLPYLSELHKHGKLPVGRTIRNEGFRDPWWLRSLRKVRAAVKLLLNGAYLIDWSRK